MNDHMTESNILTICLNSPKATALNENEFIFYHNIKKIIGLINVRVKEIEEEEEKNTDLVSRYKRLRMHDAILIDGKRGSGKTTYLQSISESLKSSPKVKVLRSIDPNQLDEKSNILLIIIANIYIELLNFIEKNYNKKEEFKNLTNKINSLTKSIKSAQDRDYKDTYDYLFSLQSNLTIDEQLHKFFTSVCSFFNVKALILPIDDIDMDFNHGYQVLDTIRKYLATPKMIPIIALDSAQAYALVKKQHYEYFSYEAKTAKSDIKGKSELGFLRKLPNEYLQKILMPTRRILLPDMLDIYKSHIRTIKNQPNKNDRQIYIRFNNIHNISFHMSLEVVLDKYMNIVYGFSGKKTEDPEHFRIINYLKNKSLRSFHEDLVAFFNGFEGNSFNPEFLKERLNPNYLEKFHNKYDATEWFWNQYVNELNRLIAEYKTNDTRNRTISVAMIKNIIIINGKETQNTIRNEKTYSRLFLKEFYIRRTSLNNVKTTKEGSVESFDIEKEFSLSGMLELMLRTFIPMSIFENLANRKKIDVFKFTTEEFIQFSSDSSVNNLNSSIHELSVWPKKFKPKKEKNKNEFIGLEIEKIYKNDFKDLANILDRTFLDDNTKYYLSPIKYIAYLMDYSKIIESNGTQQDILLLSKKYNTLFQTNGQHEKLIGLKKLWSELKFKNTNIGILSIINFSWYFSKNLIEYTYFDKSLNELKNEENFKKKFLRFSEKTVLNYELIFFHHFAKLLFLTTSKDSTNDFRKDSILYDFSRAEEFNLYKNKPSELVSNLNRIIYEHEEENAISKDNDHLIEILRKIRDYFTSDTLYKRHYFYCSSQKNQREEPSTQTNINNESYFPTTLLEVLKNLLFSTYGQHLKCENTETLHQVEVHLNEFAISECDKKDKEDRAIINKLIQALKSSEIDKNDREVINNLIQTLKSSEIDKNDREIINNLIQTMQSSEIDKNDREIINNLIQTLKSSEIDKNDREIINSLIQTMQSDAINIVECNEYIKFLNHKNKK